MTLNKLPEFLAAEDLEVYGITLADVRRRCPGAVELGPPHAPYWHRDDLAPLLMEPVEGDDQ